MRIVIFHFVLLSAVLSLSACASDSATNLRNSTAATVVQEYLNAYDLLLVKLGQVEFRRGNESGPGFDRLDTYPMYKAVEKMGLVKIENDRDLTGQFSGWNDFMALTQKGVQRLATISLTTEGQRTGNVRDHFVTFVGGSYVVENIVSNEAVESTGEKYRVVSATYRLDLKPEWREAWVAEGHGDYPDRRIRILLQYDQFAAKWGPTTIFDRGPRELGFSSEAVPRALARLRTNGSPFVP